MFRWDTRKPGEDQDARHRLADLPEVRDAYAQLRTQRSDSRPVCRMPRVFLDRGELDHLIDAETTHYQSRSASSRPDYDRVANYDSRGRGSRKRGGFLSELFD